ncbi:hypothetical protein J7643_01605 [bacterium]|nr:hypothetical protein [bacterium]
MRPFPAFALLSLLVAACQSAPVQREITAVRVAKVIAQNGTSKVFGTLAMPAALQPPGAYRIGNVDADFFRIGQAHGVSYRIADTAAAPVGRARLRVVDADGNPIPNVPAIDSDAHGVFSIPAVPTGVSMLITSQFVVNGETFTLKKYLRPSEALTCAQVDEASTLVVEKIVGANPLAKEDPGLEGADLFNLVDVPKLEAMEKAVRETLKSPNAPAPAVLKEALKRGKGGEVLDALLTGKPTLVDTFEQIYQRPDASLGLGIQAVGRNSAGIPGQDGAIVFGVIKLNVPEPPADAREIQYYLNGDKVVASQPRDTLELDTWHHPDGPYTLSTVALLADGKRQVLSKTYMQIRNTVTMHCNL